MISFIVPTLNEVGNIEKTIDKITKNFSENYNFEIIFVDDKSDDGTLDKIQSISKDNTNIKLIISEERLGLGHALIQGQAKASGEYIFFLDCDNSINYDDLNKLIKSYDENSLIIGSRYITNSKINGVNKIKIFLSRLLNFIISKYLNINAIDISHSCRLFPKKILLKTSNLRHPVFFWEHSLYCAYKNLKIVEIPIEFDERKSGKTKNSFFSLFKNIFFAIISIANLKFKYK